MCPGVPFYLVFQERQSLVSMRIIWFKDSLFFHYENMPMQYIEIFKIVKNENFQ